MGRTYSCWMLNCWCITWPVGFRRLITRSWPGLNFNSCPRGRDFKFIVTLNAFIIILYPKGGGIWRIKCPFCALILKKRRKHALFLYLVSFKAENSHILSKEYFSQNCSKINEILLKCLWRHFEIYFSGQGNLWLAFYSVMNTRISFVWAEQYSEKCVTAQVSKQGLTHTWTFGEFNDYILMRV